MPELKLPTETVSLPSKGLLYPKENPLSTGEVEMCYMTARHEDILSNSNYIRQGVVIDKLLQALIVSKINYDDLLIGDKNAIMIAARVLGYGEKYEFDYYYDNQSKKGVIDLSQLKEKKIDEKLFESRVNEFTFTTSKTNTLLTFKLLTHGDEKKIDAEIKGLQKVSPEKTTDVTTRLKYIITSVNGNREIGEIREFVDKYLLAIDARRFREYYNSIQPDIELKYYPEDINYTGEGIDVPISLNFFWPDSGL